MDLPLTIPKPHDLTLLDRHFGTMQDWRDMITEVHKRDMYVVLDNTMSTLVHFPTKY